MKSFHLSATRSNTHLEVLDCHSASVRWLGIFFDVSTVSNEPPLLVYIFKCVEFSTKRGCTYVLQCLSVPHIEHA
jgi:hypothetical protein